MVTWTWYWHCISFPASHSCGVRAMQTVDSTTDSGQLLAERLVPKRPNLIEALGTRCAAMGTEGLLMELIQVNAPLTCITLTYAPAPCQAVHSWAIKAVVHAISDNKHCRACCCRLHAPLALKMTPLVFFCSCSCLREVDLLVIHYLAVWCR